MIKNVQLFMAVAIGVVALSANCSLATLLTATTVDHMTADSLTSPIWESLDTQATLMSDVLPGIGAVDPNDDDNYIIRRSEGLYDVSFTYKTNAGYKFDKIEAVLADPESVVHRSFTATLTADGQAVTSQITTLDPVGSYTVREFTFDTDSLNSDTIVFTYSTTGSTGENAAYPFVSSIKLYVSEVPEPLTAAVIICGGTMLMVRRRFCR